jgi:hypothetical protein
MGRHLQDHHSPARRITEPVAAASMAMAAPSGAPG